jgi:hypothetical protein
MGTSNAFDANKGVRALRQMFELVANRQLPVDTDWQKMVASCSSTFELDGALPITTSAEMMDVLQEGLIAMTDFDTGYFYDQQFLPGDRTELWKNFLDVDANPRDVVQMELPSASCAGLSVATSLERFLNRLLGVSASRQALIFAMYEFCMEAVILKDMRDGKLDLGTSSIACRTITVVSDPVVVYNATNQRLVLNHLLADRGMSLDMILEEMAKQIEFTNQTVVSPRVTNQEEWEAFSAAGDCIAARFFRAGPLSIRFGYEISPGQIRVIGPKTGMHPFRDYEYEAFAGSHARLMDWSEITTSWANEYNSGTCMHGDECRNENYCRVGKRQFPVYVLTGCVVTLWSRLETMLRSAPMDYASERQIQVVQVVTDSGQRMTGVKWPPSLIDTLQENLITSLTCRLIQLDNSVYVSLKETKTISTPTLVMNDRFIVESSTHDGVYPGSRLIKVDDKLVNPSKIRRFITPRRLAEVANSPGDTVGLLFQNPIEEEVEIIAVDAVVPPLVSLYNTVEQAQKKLKA